MQTLKHKKYIILSIIILVFSGLIIFGVESYKNYQIRQTQIAYKNEQKEIQKEKLQEEVIGELKQKIEKLREDSSEVEKRQIVLEQKIITKQQKTTDLSAVIKQWRPRIAYIECNFNLYGFSSKNSFIKRGSGLLFYDSVNKIIRVLTNKHVLDEEDYLVDFCQIKFPDDDTIFTASFKNKDIRWASAASGMNWGYLTIVRPNTYIKKLSSSPITTCSKEPSIGDSVVILGYPGIGSRIDITATEGIISGYDGDYYITSAKVEQGNSGGAAIMVKENCDLGIPTFAQTGSIESLARILDLEVAIEFSE